MKKVLRGEDGVVSGAALVISAIDMLAFEGAEGLAHYCAAKSGVVGFTEAAALQVARDNALTNAIVSGPILMPVLTWVKNENGQAFLLAPTTFWHGC
jgi:3-oxoacyl-[acyl-carrier protein] reductase